MPRLIKKYPNRRLYDLVTSAYIKQDDVKDLILKGHTVQVIDVKTDKDITQMVLLQILIDMEEKEKTEKQFFNDLILHHMIRLQNHDNAFLSKAFRDYISYLSQLTHSSNVEDFTQHNLDYINQWQSVVNNFFFGKKSS